MSNSNTNKKLEVAKSSKETLLPVDNAGWGVWVEDRLSKISTQISEGPTMAMYTAFNGSTKEHDSSYYANNWLFKNTIKILKEHFPKVKWTSPAGKSHNGSALPDEVLKASLKDRKSSPNGHLMNLAVGLKETPPAVLRWLMASGFNPEGYNPDTQNTPIGYSAYKARPEYLNVFRLAGYDLSLTLRPEHLDDPEGKDGGLVGTTLLHRIVSRYPSMMDGRDDVVKELLLAGLSPFAENQNGQTPMSVAKGGALDILKRWVAQKELESLQEHTPGVKKKVRRGPRL